MYHLVAIKLLRRMNPNRIFAKSRLVIPEEAQLRRALSRLYRGIFIFERQAFVPRVSNPVAGRSIVAEGVQSPYMPPPTLLISTSTFWAKCLGRHRPNHH